MKSTKLVSIGMIAGMAMALSGCFDSTPKCDDKEVQDMLTQIIKEQLLPAAGVSKTKINGVKISYNGFMTNKIDKEAKKVTCKAQIVAKDKEEGEISEYINYTAQSTSDNQIYVEILGEE